MPLKVREIIKLIEADGWRLSRVTGRHRHDVHESKPGVVTVPGKPSKDLPIGTERSILKQATDGFALVLAGAKALLEHGLQLNLVGDRFPADA